MLNLSQHSEQILNLFQELFVLSLKQIVHKTVFNFVGMT